MREVKSDIANLAAYVNMREVKPDIENLAA